MTIVDYLIIVFGLNIKNKRGGVEMGGKIIERVCFIAPSTGILQSDRKSLNKTIRVIKKNLGVKDISLSPFLFSWNEKIGHVSASLAERLEDFRKVMKEYDLIISVAGGTGAEDIALKISSKDFCVMEERQPIFVGFSDFTFLLNEIYYFSGISAVYFTSLSLGKGNFKKIFSLIGGDEINYQGSSWLTAPPARKLSGIPVGGNLSTFANFLNRSNPPRINWKKHILFIEEFGVDNEDLHRLLAALERHKVFEKIKCIVVGCLSEHENTSTYRGRQKEALRFFKTYLSDTIKSRRDQRNPLPILAVSNFGHGVKRDLMAVPIGGYASISKSKKIVFSMKNIKK